MRKRHLLLILLMLGIVVVDQVTKEIARRNLIGRAPIHLAADTVTIVYAENRGAFLGLGANWPPAVRTAAFSGATALLVIAVLIATFRTAERWSAIAFAMVSGGGIGNLIDRFTREGAVTDFVVMGIGPLRTGVFNVADVAITTAVVLLLISSFVPERPARDGVAA